MKFDLPSNVDLGCKEYPVPISKAMLMPLAVSEPTTDGLHITDEANGLDINQVYGESDITVTIRDNRTGDEETFRYVDGVLDLTPATEEPAVVEQFSKKIKGFSKKTIPTKIKSFSKKTSPKTIKAFSRKANKYSMRHFSK